MKSCERCGSHAINEHMHGRVRGINANLCDVCYWRKAAETLLDAGDKAVRNSYLPDRLAVWNEAKEHKP